MLLPRTILDTGDGIYLDGTKINIMDFDYILIKSTDKKG